MKESKSTGKKVFNIILNVIIWIFVAFSVLVTVLAFAAQSSSDGIPELGGKCVLTVQTESMNPTFAAGDIIISDRLSEEGMKSLKVGDIISFDAGDLDGDQVNDINTHRIVDIITNGDGTVKYITKGDNPSIVATEEVAPANVKALYTDVRIKHVGKFLDFLQTSTGFLVCIVIPLIVFFVYELIKFILTFKKVKKGNKKEITEAEEELIKQRAIEEYLRAQKEAEAAASAPAEEKPAENNTPDAE